MLLFVILVLFSPITASLNDEIDSTQPDRPHHRMNGARMNLEKDLQPLDHLPANHPAQEREREQDLQSVQKSIQEEIKKMDSIREELKQLEKQRRDEEEKLQKELHKVIICLKLFYLNY